MLNHYLEKDCTSLYTIIEKLHSMSGLNRNFYRCPTTPSLAMQVFKTQFADDYKKCTKWNAFKRWYKGQDC